MCAKQALSWLDVSIHLVMPIWLHRYISAWNANTAKTFHTLYRNFIGPVIFFIGHGTKACKSLSINIESSLIGPSNTQHWNLFEVEPHFSRHYIEILLVLSYFSSVMAQRPASLVNHHWIIIDWTLKHTALKFIRSSTSAFNVLTNVLWLTTVI